MHRGELGTAKIGIVSLAHLPLNPGFRPSVIGWSLSPSHNGTKLCIIIEIFVISYSFRMVLTTTLTTFWRRTAKKDGVLQTTVAASHHHYPTMPSSHGGNNTRWYQLIVVYLCGQMGGTKAKAVMGRWRPPLCWKVHNVAALFLLVFCMLFYVETITVIAENRIKSIININIF
jgi:hypothetical protein